jgi:hypothetical protein
VAFHGTRSEIGGNRHPIDACMVPKLRNRVPVEVMAVLSLTEEVLELE